MSLRVTSEIGKLKSVLVHLPGPEIDRMVPAMMEELLFDDILYGDRAREEHRRFQQVLGYVADEVLEIPGPARGGPAGPRAAGRHPGRPRQDARLGPGHATAGCGT